MSTSLLSMNSAPGHASLLKNKQNHLNINEGQNVLITGIKPPKNNTVHNQEDYYRLSNQDNTNR
eukprot:UN04020